MRLMTLPPMVIISLLAFNALKLICDITWLQVLASLLAQAKQAAAYPNQSSPAAAVSLALSQ